MLLFGTTRSGASLIELLVVLFIMGIMMSLLLPALNSARESANEMVCKNNLYQVNVAMHRHRGVRKRLPPPGAWTIELLPFLEEAPLYQALRNANPAAVAAAKTLLPVYSCTAQGDATSKVAGVPTCHYVLIIDAPPDRRRLSRISWRFADREMDLPNGKLEPWYVGPEMQPAQFQSLVAAGRGPHRGGVFFP